MPVTSELFSQYAERLQRVLATTDWSGVATLATEMTRCWRDGQQVFLCGNGGSAGNAVHLANDFLYGIAKRHGGGLRAHALSANPAVLTCLANDIGYDRIFSEQLAVLANPGDVLIALSGSGNSSNVVAAIEQAQSMDVFTCAVLGYSGGKCKTLADLPLHFSIDDMQIAEDLQLVVGHMLMQHLYSRRDDVAARTWA
jgi:D-sedoheptulose 7-phosphate isomerase